MANIVKLGGGSGGSQPVLITKSIIENGTYNAVDDSADGYSSVEVDVGGLGTTQFRYIKMTISAINGGTHLQMSEIGFKTDDGTRFSMPTGYTATSSLPMFDPSLYMIDNLFDSNTNTKIVIAWTAGTSVEDITIDLGSGNYLDIEDYPYFFWSSSDDDSQYQGRTPRTFTVVGANQSDFSDSVVLVDEPILEKITTNRTEAYRVKMSINGIIPAKTLLYSLEQTQGGQWFNTNIDTTQYDKLLFINSVNGDDEYMREIAISDIIVVNSGTSDTYTEVFSAGAIGKMFICHIYNNELWVGYSASGSSGNVVSVYNKISGGGGEIGEYVDLSSFAHYFRRNTTTPTVTQVSTTEVTLTYQDQNNSGYELSSYSFPLDKGIYVVDIYATTSAVGSQRAYYTWGIYSTESSGWAQLNGNTPMDNQTLNTYVPFVADTNEHFYEVPLKLLEDGTGYICFATAGDGGVNATITVRSLKIRKVSING